MSERAHNPTPALDAVVPCLYLEAHLRRANAVGRWACRVRIRRLFAASFLLGLAALGQAADQRSQTNEVVSALRPLDGWTGAKTDITCKPAYYRRAQDGQLVPVAQARSGKGFAVDGVILSILEPDQFKGKVVAFHFDFPEAWDNWYLPDFLYQGQVQTGEIGTLDFMCDPGCFVPVTNPLPSASLEQLKPLLRHPVWGSRFAAAVKDQLGERVLFDALYSFLTDTNRSSNAYADQKTAAELLVHFQPACGVPLSRAMSETFGMWDESVGDWPLYLCRHFGRDNVLKLVDQAEKTKSSETERDKIEIWLLWMSTYETEEAVAPRN